MTTPHASADMSGAANEDLLAASAMDRGDLRILSDLLSIYETVDPMPEMLPDLVLFGLDAQNLDAEYARLVESELAVSGASGTRSVEHARRVTFASDNLTVMVVVNPQRDGSIRLDGWAAPGGRLHAELRVGADTLTAECDESGRFVFETRALRPRAAGAASHPGVGPVADAAGRHAGRAPVGIPLLGLTAVATIPRERAFGFCCP